MLKNLALASITAPTRELAIQVNDELKRLSKHDELNILVVYGGDSINNQIRSLKRNVNIEVANRNKKRI